MSKTYIGAYNVVNPNLSYNQSNGSVSNPMTSDLDAGSNKVINLANPADSGDAVNLQYLESVLPDVSGVLTNPMTTNLGMGAQNITNLGSLIMNDIGDSSHYTFSSLNGTLNSVDNFDTDSSQLFITINQTLGKKCYTDFRTTPLTNLSTLNFSDGGTISKSSSSFQLNQPLDMNNNYIKDVQNIQFYNAPALQIDLTNNLEYNGAIVVTASNIDNYITQASWQPNAGSNLNMGQYDINLSTGGINLDTGKIYFQDTNSLTVDGENLEYNGESVLTVKPQAVGSYPWTDATPGTAVDVFDQGNFILLNTTNAVITNSGIWQNPVIEFNITIVPTSGQAPLDLTNPDGYIEIAGSDTANPVNATILRVFMSAKQSCLTPQTDGSYTLNFRTDNIPSGIATITDWAGMFTYVGTSVYFSAYASLYPTGSSLHYYVNATGTMQAIQQVKSIANNEILVIGNEYESLQTYYVSPKTLITTASNTITLFTFYPLFGNDTIYFKTMLLGSNFCVKLSGCIFDGSVLENSVSSSIVYNLGSVFSNPVLTITGFNLQCAFNWNISYDPANSHYVASKTKIFCC